MLSAFLKAPGSGAIHDRYDIDFNFSALLLIFILIISRGELWSGC